jgi:hypothetical protein
MAAECTLLFEGYTDRRLWSHQRSGCGLNTGADSQRGALFGHRGARTVLDLLISPSATLLVACGGVERIIGFGRSCSLTRQQ